MPRVRPPLGLRQRLLLAIMAPLTIVFAVSVVLDYRMARETADAAFDQSLADTVLDIASHLQADSTIPSAELLAEAQTMQRTAAPDRLFFSVRDSAGRLLVGDADLPTVEVARNSRPQFANLRYRDLATRTAVHRIDSRQGDLTITVAQTVSKRQNASQRILTAMILPNVVVIVATVLAVYVGVRRGLVPLAQVEEQIAARSPLDLREIETASIPQEIRPMLSRLNELFGLLRAASAAQQRFLAEAAHQLRTPLAGLQTQIELATNEGRFATDHERLARIEDATGRMTHLVNQLLTYARAEPTAAASQVFEPVALHRLAEQAASIFLDRALAKGIDLGFDITPAEVTGISWMLREALANLIDNALRYTPPNGVVTVRTGQRDGAPFMEVEDDGFGIPETERELVFGRFYRIPGSPGDGCGMGLAIVREIAELHGAAVRLAASSSGGLRASIDFRQQDVKNRSSTGEPPAASITDALCGAKFV